MTIASADEWLYRRENIDAEPGVRWCCGVEGCDYGYDAKNKGRLGQDLIKAFVHKMRAKTRRALVPPPIYVAGEIIRELRKALENKQGAIGASRDDVRKAA